MITLNITREDANNLLSLITALNSRRDTLRQMEHALLGAGHAKPAAFLHDLRQVIVLGNFTLKPVTEQCRRQTTYCHDTSEEVSP